MVKEGSAHPVVVDLREYLERRRGHEQPAAATQPELPLFAQVRNGRHDRKLAHRRRMLAHLTLAARGYA